MRYAWHNGHHLMKWNQHTEFKSWLMLLMFHFALIPSGERYDYLFSRQLLQQNGFFSFGKMTSLGERKLCIQTSCSPLKKLTLCHILLVVAEQGGVNTHISKKILPTIRNVFDINTYMVQQNDLPDLKLLPYKC